MANPGKLLYFSQLGGEQPIPPEFIAAMERWETKQSAGGNKVEHTPLSDTVVESRFDTDRTNELVHHVVGKKPGNIVLRGIRTNDQGQGLQLTLTLFRTDDTAFVKTYPTSTASPAVHDLGNGWSIQEIVEEGSFDDAGVFTPGIFQGIELSEEREDPVPSEFRTAIPLDKTESVVEGTVEAPTLGVNDIRVSQRQLALHKKILSTLTRQNIALPVTLTNKKTNEKGQVVTESRTYRVVGSAPAPTALENVTVLDLGEGHEVLITEVIPEIFQGISLSEERADPIPEKFRTAAPITKTESVVTGTVSPPSLGSGQLLTVEEQITKHIKLLRTLTRQGLSLPIILVSKRTNDKKQLVVVTDEYRVAATADAISAVKDVTILDLGEGYEVQTTEVIPEVFHGETYTKEIEDLLPPRFRGVVPTTLFRHIIDGTAEEPSLDPGAGELKRSEQQVTVLTKMVELLSRSVDFDPAVVIVDQQVITEYGGGKMNITYTIGNVNTLAVEDGPNIVASEVTKLGEGHEFRKTISQQDSSWPTRTFARWVPRIQAFITGTKQVVGKGTTIPGISSGVVTEIEPIDGYREDKVVSTQPLSAVDAYFRVIEGNNTNVDCPPELVSLTGYIDLGGGDGSYSEDGAYALSANVGGGNIQLRGNAQASAFAIPELGRVVKIPRTSNIPCVHVLLFVPIGTTRANIINAIATHVAGVTDWPDFRPQPIVVKGVGGKVNLSVQVAANAHDSITTDYLGVLKYNSWSRSAGGGSSFDISTQSRIWEFSPTIHAGTLTIGGTTSADTSHANSGHDFQAYGHISGGVNGTVADTGVLQCRAGGSLTIISSTAATAGTASYASLGKRVHRLVTELDPDFDRLKVFAEIVDFDAHISP